MACSPCPWLVACIEANESWDRDARPSFAVFLTRDRRICVSDGLACLCPEPSTPEEFDPSERASRRRRTETAAWSG